MTMNEFTTNPLTAPFVDSINDIATAIYETMKDVPNVTLDEMISVAGPCIMNAFNLDHEMADRILTIVLKRVIKIHS